MQMGWLSSGAKAEEEAPKTGESSRTAAWLDSTFLICNKGPSRSGDWVMVEGSECDGFGDGGG